MRLQTLDPAELDLVRQVEELYLSAFPEEERLPVDAVLHRRDLGREVQVATDEQGLLGLVVTIPQPGLGATFLEYLAVDPRRRSGGIGGELLRRLLDRVGDLDVLAELEPAGTSPDADRRERFYDRNGFEPAGWQGAYGMPGPGGELVPLTLWHREGFPAPGDPAGFMRAFYERTYGDRGRPHLAHVLTHTRTQP